MRNEAALRHLFTKLPTLGFLGNPHLLTGFRGNRRYEKAGAVVDPGLEALRRAAGYYSASVPLSVAHPLAVVGDVIVPVGPNHVAALPAIDSVPTVAITYIYEIAPLLGVHNVAVTIDQLGQNVVSASGADDTLGYLKSLAAVSALVGTVCS